MEKEKKVIFENCPTYGDQIDALFNHFADSLVDDFVMEEAIKKCQIYRKKRDELKSSFTKEMQ